MIPAVATDGTCSRCERSITPPPRPGVFVIRRFHVDRLVPAYWGEALCPDCCQAAAMAYDLVGWPPFPSPSP